MKAEGDTEANFASASSRGRGNMQPPQESHEAEDAEGGTEANVASASSRGRGNLEPSQESHEAEDAVDPAGISPDWDPEADYGLSDGEEASDETVEETATPEETAVLDEVKQKRPLPRPTHLIPQPNTNFHRGSQAPPRAPTPTKARPVPPPPPAPPVRPPQTMRTPSRSPTRQHDAVDDKEDEAEDSEQQKKQRK
jgi:hypothetical protein